MDKSSLRTAFIINGLVLFLLGICVKIDAEPLATPTYVARAKMNLAGETVLTPDNISVSAATDTNQIPRGAMWLTAPEEAYGFRIYRERSKGDPIGGRDLIDSARMNQSAQKTDPLWMQYAKQSIACDKARDFTRSHQYEEGTLADLTKMGKSGQRITYMDEAFLLFNMLNHSKEREDENARTSAELKKSISDLSSPNPFSFNIDQLNAQRRKMEQDRLQKATAAAAKDKRLYSIMSGVLPPKCQLVRSLADSAQRSSAALAQAEPKKISPPTDSPELTNIKRHASRVESYTLPKSTSDQAVLGCAQGQLQLQSDDYKAALKSFSNAVGSDPKCAEAYDGRGYAKAKLADYSGAIDDFNAVLKLSAKDPIACFNRGVAECWSKNYGKAIDDFDQVLKTDKFDAVALFNRGFAKDRLGQAKAGTDDFEQASKMITFMKFAPIGRVRLQLDPGEVYLYFTKNCQGRAPTAKELTAVGSGLQINSDHKASAAFMDEANQRYKDHDYKGAIAACDKALKADTFRIDAYNMRMMAHYGLGDRQAASADIQAMNKATAWQTKYMGASSAASRTGTIEQYNNILKVNPTDSFAWYGRGQRRSDLGDYKGAVEDFTMALKYRPNDAHAYHCRGDARKNLGDKQGADADYKEAAKHDAMYALMNQFIKR